MKSLSLQDAGADLLEGRQDKAHTQFVGLLSPDFIQPPNISSFWSSLRVRKYKKSEGGFKQFRCQIMSWMVIICDSIPVSLSVSSQSQDYPKDYNSLELRVSQNQKLQMKIRYLQSLRQAALQVSLAFQTKVFKKKNHQYRGKFSRTLLIRKHQN